MKCNVTKKNEFNKWNKWHGFSIHFQYIFYYCIHKWSFYNTNFLHAAKINSNKIIQGKNEPQDSMHNSKI